MKSLGVILFNSVGAGYAALNMAGRFEALEILEFAPLGAASQILVLGEQKIVNSFIVELRTGDIERSICLPNFDEKILRSYLSLENSKLQDFVLVIESHFTGDLFSVAAELKNLGLETVDFRVFRTQGSPGFLTMTGKNLSQAETWVAEQATRLASRALNLSLLTSLSEGFRHFVDFDS